MTVYFDAVNELYPQARVLGVSEYYKGRSRVSLASPITNYEEIPGNEEQAQAQVINAIANGATRLVLTVQDLNGTIYYPDFKAAELIWT